MNRCKRRFTCTGVCARQESSLGCEPGRRLYILLSFFASSCAVSAPTSLVSIGQSSGPPNLKVIYALGWASVWKVFGGVIGQVNDKRSKEEWTAWVDVSQPVQGKKRISRVSHSVPFCTQEQKCLRCTMTLRHVPVGVRTKSLNSGFHAPRHLLPPSDT